MSADDFALLRSFISESRRISVDAEEKALAALTRIEERSKSGVCAYCGLVGSNDPERVVDHITTCAKRPDALLMAETDRLRTAISRAIRAPTLDEAVDVLRVAMGEREKAER